MLLRRSCGSWLAHGGKGVVADLAEGDPFLRSLSAGVFGGFVAVCVAAFTTSIWETLVVEAGFLVFGRPGFIVAPTRG